MTIDSLSFKGLQFTELRGPLLIDDQRMVGEAVRRMIAGEEDTMYMMRACTERQQEIFGCTPPPLRTFTLPAAACQRVYGVGDGGKRVQAALTHYALSVCIAVLLDGGVSLDELLRRFSGHASAAIGSYNAGPHRVVNWLDGPALEDDEWVEAIPYDQPRKYVKRVLRSQQVYRVLY